MSDDIKPAKTADESGQPFMLPEEVDEPLFREFLAAQVSSLASIENDILRLEETRAAAEAIANLRRVIHTLKGEAGVLGLDALVEVCMAFEDALVDPQQAREQVDRLLQAKDWISSALAAYGRKLHPDFPASIIIEMLKAPMLTDAMAPMPTVEAAALVEAPPAPTPPVQAAAPAKGAKSTSTGKAKGKATPPPVPSAPVQEAAAPVVAAPVVAAPVVAAPIVAAPVVAAPIVAAPVVAAPVVAAPVVAAPVVAAPVVAAPVVAAPVVAAPVVAAPVVAAPVVAAPVVARGPRKAERDEETISMIGDFLQESDDSLVQADQLLMRVEGDATDPEAVNGLFRVFHTIKGVAGFLEFTDIGALAHTTETLLNKARQRTLTLDRGAVDLLLDATQMMRRLLLEVRRAVQAGEETAHAADLAPLIARLTAAIEGRAAAAPAAAVQQAAAPTAAAPTTATPTTAAPEVVPASNAPEVTSTSTANDAHDNVVTMESLRTPPPDEERAAPPPPPSGGGDKDSGAKLKETVRVDIDRVDAMVEMIGELVIVESMIAHAPEMSGLPSMGVRNYLSQLTKISRDLQGLAMRMRMVPVRAVFQKMARMVRELSRKSGKEIVLVTAGEGTEMDRSMVERISDPLVHMIRNGVDHGVEGPDERRASGKSPQGTIKLSAYHQGGNIVVELSDDGRGLNREAILKKARSQGLIAETQKLSDNEIYNLIFRPGFSTAKQVTEISGRGVGMDVVKRNIESMRGRVNITTTPGHGTVFKMVLPLTLAIIEGTLIACGKERYIIPTLSIVESIKPNAAMLATFRGKDELLHLRGETLPLYRLARLLHIDDAVGEPTQGLAVIVESMGQRIGVLVDDVVTQQQVVIKRLDEGLDDQKCFSGAAILSDGRVGLILNIDEIGRLVDGFRKRPFNHEDREAVA